MAIVAQRLLHCVPLPFSTTTPVAVRLPSFKRQQKRTLDDAELENEFIAAYDEYANAIFRHCAYRLGEREKAKELMQETYLKAWEYILDGHEVDNMRAFLYRVANNLLIDYVRRLKKRTVVSLEDMQEAGMDIPEENFMSNPKRLYEQRRVVETIELIEEPYRTALVMRHIDGLPPKHIAKILKVSPNVVSVRVNRGLKRLEELLNPSGD